MAQSKLNPISDALEQGKEIVRIKGYVGRSGDGQIEVYPKLSPTTRLAIDASDIVYTSTPEKDDEPASIFVRDSAEVQVVSTIKAAALQRPGVGGTGGVDACERYSEGEFDECIDLGFDLGFCINYSWLVLRACRRGDLSPRVGPVALE